MFNYFDCCVGALECVLVCGLFTLLLVTGFDALLCLTLLGIVVTAFWVGSQVSDLLAGVGFHWWFAYFGLQRLFALVILI